MMAFKRRARVGIKLRTDVKAPVSNLANIDSYVGVSKADGVENEIVGAKGFTPLYKAAGIKEHIFSGPEFVYTKGYYTKQRIPIFAEI